MLELLESTIKPLSLNFKTLDVAYALDLQAPQATPPTIDWRSRAQKMGNSPLDARHASVEVNRLNHLPDCKLQT